MPESSNNQGTKAAAGNGGVLFAVYDLAVSPLTFDICPFLVAAEIARLDAGCERMHFILAPKEGTGADEHYGRLGNVSEANFAWRGRQIVVAATALMPSCRSVSVAATRAEAATLIAGAETRIYPENYAVEAPIAGFSIGEIEAWARRGGEIPTLAATEQALTYVRRWIDQHAGGRRPVSITLREALNAEGKNSDAEAWARFAKSIDNDLYFPFLIRDTDRVFDDPPELWEGVEQFPLAAVNLELRAAIYESSYLNMIGSSGPTQLCLFDRQIRCLVHNLGVPGWHDTRPDSYRENYGIEMGDQLALTSPYQRLAWGGDDYETIARHFDMMTRYIERGREGLGSDQERRFFAANDEDANIFAERLYQGRQWGPAKKIYRHLLTGDPDNAEHLFRLGVAETWGQDPEKGLALIEKAIDLGCDRAEAFVGKGEALLFLGRAEQAAANFQMAVETDPDCFTGVLRLGMLFEAQEDLAEARRWLERAVEIDPSSSTARDYLGLILKRLGLPEAADTGATHPERAEA